MKKLFPVAIIFCCLLCSFLSCKKDKDVVPDDPNAVGLYDCSDKNMRAEPYICFDSLIADAHCPSGVECIWAGYTLIKVTFHENNQLHTFKMMTPFTIPAFGGVKDTTINNYKITFGGLAPYQLANGEQPTVKDIKAIIKISQ